MPEPGEKPRKEGIEVLYVGEPLELRVLGIVFKIKDLSGDEFMALTKKCMPAGSRNVDTSTFLPALMKEVILSPEIDISKLSVKAFTLLGAKIQDALGLSDVVSKNL